MVCVIRERKLEPNTLEMKKHEESRESLLYFFWFNVSLPKLDSFFLLFSELLLLLFCSLTCASSQFKEQECFSRNDIKSDWRLLFTINAFSCFINVTEPKAKTLFIPQFLTLILPKRGIHAPSYALLLPYFGITGKQHKRRFRTSKHKKHLRRNIKSTTVNKFKRDVFIHLFVMLRCSFLFIIIPLQLWMYDSRIHTIHKILLQLSF